jgi:hypothetical protein
MLIRRQLPAGRSLFILDRVNPPGINSLLPLGNRQFISNHLPHLAILQQQCLTNLLQA